MKVQIEEKRQKQLSEIVKYLKKRFGGNPFEYHKSEIDEETAINVAITEYYKLIRDRK